MAITSGNSTPKPKPKFQPGGFIGVNPKPRKNGGISGPGGKNVKPDYKETGTSIIDKIKNLIHEAGTYPEYKPTLEQELKNLKARNKARNRARKNK